MNAPKEHRPTVSIVSRQSTLRVPRKRIRQLVELVDRAEGSRLGEVDVAVVAGEEMRTLNRRFLNHAWDTDVLSFDLTDEASGGGGLSVQVVICADVAARQGPAHGLSRTRELLLYVTHGLLHQLGYEDKTVRGAARMRARQDELLAELLDGG
jgi:probable rRNA maturation factor